MVLCGVLRYHAVHSGTIEPDGIERTTDSMILKQRIYTGESGWQAISDLIQSDPHFYNPIDFPWRLCSTSLEDHRNGAVWENENGQLQVFAALQFPWLTFEYAIRPEFRTQEIEIQVITWGENRLRQIAQETKDDFPFNISVYAHETERIAFLEAQGYIRWDNHMVVLQRPLTDLSIPSIPEGFTIRPLAGEAEVEQYAELQRIVFESNNMTARWRRHTLHAPLYDPDLDLVAVAPDGRLAGFCIWWYRPDLKTSQIEPLGVHPDFQQLGLSQALMAEGFRRAVGKGADTARVETYSFSTPALNSYEAAGFRVLKHQHKYFKEY